MKGYRAARQRVSVSVGESVRILRELPVAHFDRDARRRGLPACGRPEQAAHA